MKVDKELTKGSHELILLKLLSRKDMYGYELIQEMSLLSEQVFAMSQGSLYPFLHGLEDRGLIQSYTREAGGRERRYYRLTPAGQGALEEGLHRGHHKGQLPPAHLVHEGQAAVLPLAGDSGRVVEGEGPGGEDGDLAPGEGGHVPGQALALPLVGTHQHHRTVGIEADGGGDVGAVDRRCPGQGHRAAARLQGGGELFEFLQAVQRPRQ